MRSFNPFLSLNSSNRGDSSVRSCNRIERLLIHFMVFMALFGPRLEYVDLAVATNILFAVLYLLQSVVKGFISKDLFKVSVFSGSLFVLSLFFNMLFQPYTDPFLVNVILIFLRIFFPQDSLLIR